MTHRLDKVKTNKVQGPSSKLVTNGPEAQKLKINTVVRTKLGVYSSLYALLRIRNRVKTKDAHFVKDYWKTNSFFFYIFFIFPFLFFWIFTFSIFLDFPFFPFFLIFLNFLFFWFFFWIFFFFYFFFFFFSFFLCAQTKSEVTSLVLATASIPLPKLKAR